MEEKISESELEFCECLYNPVSAAECLISDMDNLSFFNETQSHVRLGQVTLLSFEYLIDDSNKLTKQENFRRKQGAGNNYCLGGRNFGKCEWIENLCLLANGGYVKFGDLINTKQLVLGLNPNTLKLEKTEAYFTDNGVKDCIEFTLKSGKKITVTKNHPLLTDFGWIEAKNINQNHFIATSANYGELGNIEVDENLAKLLGYLLGDGGCTSQINFTNIDKELIDEFKEIVDYYGCDIRKTGITYNVKFRGKREGGNAHSKIQNNPILSFVREYGIDTLAKYKKIPDEVFQWKNKYISLLLNRFYACDGHLNRSNNTIELSLASEALVDGVQKLLLRFGVHSYKYSSYAICKSKKFCRYRLFVGNDINLFLDKIGIKTKDENYNYTSKYSVSNVIPNNILRTIYKELKNKKAFILRKLLTNKSSSKRKCLDLGVKSENGILIKLAESDIFWDKINKIEKINNQSTVTVSVPKYNNYISNDIISHNSLMQEKVDVLLSLILNDGYPMSLASYDAIHIRSILEPVITALTFHPIFSAFRKSCIKSPTYLIMTKNGVALSGVNMNLIGKDPGAQWFGKHEKKIWVEEASFETDKVYKKRVDSRHELGCIERISGMTTFTKHSPAGKVFYDLSKRPWMINLPQTINPNFDEKTKKEAIKKYGGKNSIGYKVFVEGEVVEEGVSVFDMERIRKNYDDKKEIKILEVSKELYLDYKNILIVERPKNADKIYICADIGESAPTEIVVISEVNRKYRYLYNISLFGLTDKEQFYIFQYLGITLEANHIGLDTTDGTGRAIFGRLGDVFPRENLVWVHFSEKIDVDFEKNKQGDPLYENGKLVYKQEYVAEWSIQRLKDILYEEGKINIPLDYKFDIQLNSVIAIQTANRITYKCVSEADHLFAAFRVFSITEWNNEFSLIKPIVKKIFNKTGVF